MMMTLSDHRRHLAERFESCYTSVTIYHPKDFSTEHIVKILREAGCIVEIEDGEDNWGHSLSSNRDNPPQS